MFYLGKNVWASKGTEELGSGYMTVRRYKLSINTSLCRCDGRIEHVRGKTDNRDAPASKNI